MTTTTTQLTMKVGAPRPYVYGNGRSNLDYDSDDEPLVYADYETADDDGDDEPLMTTDEWSKMKTYVLNELEKDDDDEPLMTTDEWSKMKTADFNLLEKEKTRKATQQRAKFLMDKYNFKIKGWYNMKRDDIIRECFRQL